MKFVKNIIMYITIFFGSNCYAAVDYFDIKLKDEKIIRINVSDLEKLPQNVFTTTTNFTGKEEFTGPTIKDVFDFYNIKGDFIHALAWDEYTYKIPIKELESYGVIFAYKRNGKYMDIKTLGPVGIVYPKDKLKNINNLDVNAKTVWQIKLLTVD